MKAILKGGDEQDAFTRWRHFLHWSKGDLKRIKRRLWKRQRREAKAAISSAEQENQCQ